MSVNIFQWITIFTTIVSLGGALFFGFASYDWVCEYMDVLGMKGKCDIQHMFVFILAIGLFALSLISYRNFNVRNVLFGKGGGDSSTAAA